MIWILAILVIGERLNTVTCRNVRTSDPVHDNRENIAQLLLPLLAPDVEKDQLKVEVVPYGDYASPKTELDRYAKRHIADINGAKRKETYDRPVAIIIAQAKNERGRKKNDIVLQDSNFRIPINKEDIFDSFAIGKVDEIATNEQAAKPNNTNSETGVPEVKDDKSHPHKLHHSDPNNVDVNANQTARNINGDVKVETSVESESVIDEGWNSDEFYRKYLHDLYDEVTRKDTDDNDNLDELGVYRPEDIWKVTSTSVSNEPIDDIGGDVGNLLLDGNQQFYIVSSEEVINGISSEEKPHVKKDISIKEAKVHTHPIQLNINKDTSQSESKSVSSEEHDVNHHHETDKHDSKHHTNAINDSHEHNSNESQHRHKKDNPNQINHEHKHKDSENHHSKHKDHDHHDKSHEYKHVHEKHSDGSEEQKKHINKEEHHHDRIDKEDNNKHVTGEFIIKDETHKDVNEEDVHKVNVNEEDAHVPVDIIINNDEGEGDGDFSDEDLSEEDLSEEDIIEEDISEEDISEVNVNEDNISEEVIIDESIRDTHEIANEDLINEDVINKNENYENIVGRNAADEDATMQNDQNAYAIAEDRTIEHGTEEVKTNAFIINEDPFSGDVPYDHIHLEHVSDKDITHDHVTNDGVTSKEHHRSTHVTKDDTHKHVNKEHVTDEGATSKDIFHEDVNENLKKVDEKHDSKKHKHSEILPHAAPEKSAKKKHKKKMASPKHSHRHRITKEAEKGHVDDHNVAENQEASLIDETRDEVLRYIQRRYFNEKDDNNDEHQEDHHENDHRNHHNDEKNHIETESVSLGMISDELKHLENDVLHAISGYVNGKAKVDKSVDHESKSYNLSFLFNKR